ncbi:hypothetical protein [uncultured Cohaesibacter sp.]|uniref:hypothetical protein n=1 Tax=uncultured Cohaesibacter sp. TaxID=1002546 RepID=UPI0029C92B21|nr:hypothetical protein [uncultured Cohaesibacter sp.]
MAYMIQTMGFYRYQEEHLKVTPRYYSYSREDAVAQGPIKKPEECELTALHCWDETGTVYCPKRFATAKEAWQWAIVHASPHDLVLVVPYDDPRWMAREADLFRCVYDRAPWHNEPWVQREETSFHFPHVAKGDPTKLAYTPDEAKGRQDIQVVTRPGRYLRKFYGDVLTNDEIEHWTQKWAAGEIIEVEFAKTPDEIQYVYEEGPNSCMSHSLSDYDSPCHPVRVYGNSDVQLAYIKRYGRITARALVWPEKMQISRIYGDEGRLRPKLEELGYSDGDLRGARIRRITDPNEGRLVMPYIDKVYTYEELDDDWCCIGGSCQAEETTGYSSEYAGDICPHCGERHRPDDFTYIDSEGESWCDDCAEEHSFYCGYSQEQVSYECSVTLANGDDCSEAYFNQYGYTCAIDDERYIEERDPCAILHDGEVFCAAYIDNGVTKCLYDGEYYPDIDMTQVEGGWVADCNLDFWNELSEQEQQIAA